MSDTVIRVENLGKKYIIGHQSNGHRTLRDVLADSLSAPFRWLRRTTDDGRRTSDGRRATADGPASPVPGLPLGPRSPVAGRSEEFWALKDVSFEVTQGEVVGIIGRNGAGKSTLLKILSRITEPTEGRVRIRGRVASLLEVGTGFHPELTGRENVFLNGAILGMTREEIKRKFDEIVAFAEVEKFLDTPVKRYSSGMYVRLAFAVAAHLEPEILIVDEVLAVGDFQFQRKCLGKMEQVGKEGRTVLFVSHNMAVIRNLCRIAIFLKDGRILQQADTEKVIKRYLSDSCDYSALWKRRDGDLKHTAVFFDEVTITNSNNVVTSTLDLREAFRVNIGLLVQLDVDASQVAIRFVNQEGVAVFTTADSDMRGGYTPLGKGRYKYSVMIPAGFLSPGIYSVVVATMRPGVTMFDIIQNELKFSIEDTGNYATSLQDGRLGLVNLQLEWERHRDGIPY